MLVIQDECIGCPSEMGCMGRACPHQNVTRFYCDGCGNEDDVYYEYEGEYFCKDCFIEIMLESAEKYTAEELIERGG